MKRFALFVALAVATTVAGLLAVGPAVRALARARAARWGAAVEIDAVRLRWGTVRLEGVRMSCPELAPLEVSLDRVELGIDRAFGVASVGARGGRVELAGSFEDLVGRARRYRDAHLPVASGERSERRRTISVSGLEVVWRDAPGGAEVGHLSGALIRQDGEALAVDAAEVRGAHGAISFAGRALRVTAARATSGVELTNADLDALSVEVDGGVARASGSSSGLGARGSGEPPTLERARDRLVEVASLFASHFAARGAASVTNLRAVLHFGGESLGLGPGGLRIRRDGDAVVGELVPGAKASSSPLALRARVPVVSGPVDIELSGGPITLSALGAREGDLGFVEVDKASLDAAVHATLSADARSVDFDGRGRLRGLSVANRALARDTLRGLDAAFRARGRAAADGSSLAIEAGALDVGEVRLEGSGDLAREGERLRGHVRFAMPLAACQGVFDSLPAAMLPHLGGTRLAGTMTWHGEVGFDTDKLDEIELAWSESHDCRLTDVPVEIAASRFRRPFTLRVYSPSGDRAEIQTGPGSPAWVPLSAMSSYLEAAVTTTEDGGFRRHRGFDQEAIRRSIRENLRERRFARGASTLSMQLAKNLYLDREKTLSRKVEEAFLTMYLEQELTKDELLELYWNVVELGPMVYGVGPASEHYFASSPHELSLAQALYLASILPNPKASHFSKDGTLSEGWQRYLRRLMTIMLERKKISEQELRAGLSETIGYRRSRAPAVRAPSDGVPEPTGEAPWEPPAAP